MRKAGSCNLPYCASGFKILLVRVSDRRNDRDDDQWIPYHQLDYSKFTSNQFAWNQSDEWRLVWIRFGYLNQDPEWQKMSSGFRINSTIRTLHPIAFLRIGSWRGVCQFWWPQSGPGIRRCKKQGGKLAKLFFHLPHPRECLRSAPLLIFLLFHCSSYLSDPAVYFSWFLPTFWCVVWRVSPYFLVTAVSSMWRRSSWWCPQDLRSSFFPFFQIAESKVRKPSLLSPASVFLGVRCMACVGPVVACRG